MQEFEKDNPGTRPEEGNGRYSGNSQDLITEDVVRGMFGESGESRSSFSRVSRSRQGKRGKDPSGKDF